MQYESLIFDIDGTLWDSRALVAEGYNIQLKAEGLEHLCVTAEDLKPLFGKVMSDIADAMLDDKKVEGGSIDLVLPHGIGCCAVCRTPLAEVGKVVSDAV